MTQKNCDLNHKKGEVKEREKEREEEEEAREREREREREATDQFSGLSILWKGKTNDIIECENYDLPKGKSRKKLLNFLIDSFFKPSQKC